MKKFIQKILRESLLSERLTDVNADVDLIYDLGFRDDVDRLKETGVLTDDMFPKSEFDTKYLKAEESINAHKLNPCRIEINHAGNFYKPSTNLISVGIHAGAKGLIIDNGGKLNDTNKYLNDKQAVGIRNEFTEGKIKGSIHHELVHWIDDTINNRHIAKAVSSPDTMKKLHSKNVNTNYMELQAQIHNIVQLKRKNEDIWNGLKFMDLVDMSPTLNNIYYNLSGDARSEWIRNLKTRMYREGLLGKTMANY
jgi:hypothetical protein